MRTVTLTENDYKRLLQKQEQVTELTKQVETLQSNVRMLEEKIALKQDKPEPKKTTKRGGK